MTSLPKSRRDDTLSLTNVTRIGNHVSSLRDFRLKPTVNKVQSLRDYACFVNKIIKHEKNYKFMIFVFINIYYTLYKITTSIIFQDFNI
jgi:hypothetical protein